MTAALRPIDRAEITILVDNYTDFLLTENNRMVQRPVIPFENVLLAEHGLSFLIRIFSGTESHTILMDAGNSGTTLFHNARELHLNLDDIEEIIISHGHFDHFGSLVPLLRSLSCRTPVHLHPRAFSERRKKMPNSSSRNFPILDKDILTHAGAVLNFSTDPSLLANRYMLITGEIERTTSFEQGSPVLEAFDQGDWIADPFWDDQSLVLNLASHGLVVISGCAHAGIINSVRYAQKITGINQVHAVIGGFHLSGQNFEQVISPTISALHEIAPEWVIPMHCTGWCAINEMNKVLPGKVLINTVGTRYCLESEMKIS